MDVNFLSILTDIYPLHIRIIHFPKESELFYFRRGFYLYFIVLNNGEFGKYLEFDMSMTFQWNYSRYFYILER